MIVELEISGRVLRADFKAHHSIVFPHPAFREVRKILDEIGKNCIEE
jgi:hypothetical protein